MEEFENLELDNVNGILRLTINRPDKMNALNLKTIQELREAFQMIYDDKTIKGVIITGAGEKAFVAGADIKEIASLNEVNGRKFAENGQEVFFLIESCPKPVIAAIDGYALGGGCELAMACHIRIATVQSRFGQPEVNLGIIPGYGGTQRLTHLVGKGRALEMMMTADAVTAKHAKKMGLVNHVVKNKEELLTKSEEVLSKIISKAPLAISMVINCVNAAFDPEEKGFQTEANSFASCCKSEDFEEGTNAFIQKRPAEFKGN
ncbi:MAG: enoyl-CoA hydratase-related protein [Bacteroidota bacterium]|nr:enoyl-CoA hydratase-related protein [Bacteroidota bacterium]